MSDVVIRPAAPAWPPGGLALGASGTISDPPTPLIRAAVGHILQATVTGTEVNGLVLLRTGIGALRLATSQPLATGSQVTLRLRQAGAALQAVILHVDPPKGDSRGSVVAPTPAPAPSAVNPKPSAPRQPAEAAVQDLSKPGRVVGATLQAPPRDHSLLPHSFAGLTAGQSLQLRILAIAVPDRAATAMATANPSRPMATAAATASQITQAGPLATAAQSPGDPAMPRTALVSEPAPLKPPAGVTARPADERRTGPRPLHRNGGADHGVRSDGPAKCPGAAAP